MPERKLVLFVDVVFRGDTIRRIAKTLEARDGWTRTIIVGIDMRRAPVGRLLDTNCTIHALVTHYFDPEEVPTSSSVSQVREVDSITHVPLGQACEFTDLGTTAARQAFLDGAGDLFRVGFHRLADGQLHTVSLDTGQLVRRHGDFVVVQVREQVTEFLAEINGPRGKFDCVLFCRPESRVYGLIPRIAEQLLKRGQRIRNVFVANLTVAPTSPRAVFPREENNLLADVHVQSSQGSMFMTELSTDFVGIYIDDAAMTGRSLQDVIAKTTQLSPVRPHAVLALVLVNRLSPREVRFLEVCRDLSDRDRPSADPRRSIPFRFRSLFRLQVGMISEGDRGHAGEVIRRMLDHSDFFDPGLKDYSKRIAERLQRVFDRPVAGEIKRPVVLHPFYPAGEGVETIPARTIRFRHLLALNRQNEGVLGEVLRELTELAEADEISLLSILALEPEILDETPVGMAGWPALQALCLRTIQRNVDPGIKSDAIAILFRTPNEALAALEQTLPAVVRDPSLLAQVGCLLLAFSRRDGSWLPRIRACLDAVGDKVERRTMWWLRTILDVPERVETTYVIRDDVGAIGRIRALLAATWTHVGGLDDWQTFDTRIKGLADEHLDADGIRLGLRCISFAEQVLLPGLAGIRFLSAKRLRPSDANLTWEALIEGNRRAIEIRRMLHSGPAAITVEGTRLAEAWNHLRRTTIKAASPVRVLGRPEQISSEPSVIEEYLPRLFASPHPLVAGLAQRYVPDLRFDPSDPVFAEGAILVPVSKLIILDFFRILLENMAKYGRPGHRVTSWSLVEDNSRTVLRVECLDTKRLDVPSGEGTGVPLMRALALTGGFDFEGHATDDGRRYESHVTFNGVVRVYPEIHRD